MSENLITILQIVGPILGGGLFGYFIKFILDKRTHFFTKNAEVKRNAYLELTELMLDVLSQSKTGEIKVKTMMTRLNSFYSKYLLYASPEVVNSFSNFMQFLYADGADIDPRKVLTNMTQVFKDMRKDIGLSNKALGQNAEILLRARITDYDSVFSAEWKPEDLKKEDSDSAEVAAGDLQPVESTSANKTKTSKKKRKKRR